MVGETVGSFRLAQALGRHRWGDRFAAEGAPIEVLLVDANACTERARVDRCVDDARTAAAIGLTAIAPLVEAGVHTDGRVYLATRRQGGELLTARIARTGRQSLTQLAMIGRQVAMALAAAHGKALSHRDLAPDDIEIVAAPDVPNGERVVVHGFGLAHLGVPRAPGYVAPERWDDAAAPDARTDIYALGCIVFEMACGQPPFHGSTDELRARHLSAPPPTARSIQPDVPGSLEHLLGKMLAKAPEQRPQSIGDLVRTFEVLGGGALASGPLAPTGMEPALPSPVAAPAPMGFAPAKSAMASSVQPRSVAQPSLSRAADPLPPPSSAVLHGPASSPSPAPAPAPDTTPRYSEPPAPKSGNGWKIAVAVILLVVIAGVVLAIAH